jgi:hypothetical protein
MDTLQREVQHFRSSFDLGEIIKRAIKYLVEGLVVALAAFFIPQKQMDISEIMVIALTAATTFALLDVASPSMTIANSVRQGAGWGIGLSLTGGLPIA